MGELGQIMQSNIVAGVVILLGIVVLKLIEWRRQEQRTDKGEFTESDRMLLRQLVETANRAFEADRSYQSQGIRAMDGIGAISRATEANRDAIMKLAETIADGNSKAALSQIQVANILSQLLANDGNKFELLRAIRDDQIRTGGKMPGTH